MTGYPRSLLIAIIREASQWNLYGLHRLARVRSIDIPQALSSWPVNDLQVVMLVAVTG